MKTLIELIDECKGMTAEAMRLWYLQLPKAEQDIILTRYAYLAAQHPNSTVPLTRKDIEGAR
jgi:hypothetical protein